MNCPVRTDPLPDEGHNRNPPAFVPELTTNNSLNHRANDTRARNASRRDLADSGHVSMIEPVEQKDGRGKKGKSIAVREVPVTQNGESSGYSGTAAVAPTRKNGLKAAALKARGVLVKYAKFVGPGIMISVAYIDPGNYVTDIQAGASYRFKLLFMVFLSNVIAVFLQALCAKLGTVTGLNLAENCRAHLPRWLNYTMWFVAEAAIIATDISEVIGTVISLNMLLHIPLIAGCAIAITDVIIILLFYNPTGMTLRATRIFEMFVAALVLGVVVCFCVELAVVRNISVGEVFKGYLPSSALVQSQGLFQSCGILGATVMPHSLYLGSDLVKARLRDYDLRHASLRNPPISNGSESPGEVTPRPSTTSADEDAKLYKPSLRAIQSCLTFSIWELTISLFTFALFVNSAILIVAGASLSNLPEEETSNADLFAIRDLLSSTIAPAAGTIFALALLLSGTSAGLVCTMAGQIVSEGQLRWRISAWKRRLITRAISIVPSIAVAGTLGRQGLNTALEGTQVALSLALPFCTAPLIWFTCKANIMKVWTDDEGRGGQSGVVTVDSETVGADAGASDEMENNHKNSRILARARSSVKRVGVPEVQGAETGIRRFVVMRNNLVTSIIAVIVWLFLVIMNGALIVLAIMGKE